jgi:hypothetical protein
LLRFRPGFLAGTAGSPTRAGLAVDKARKVIKKSIYVEREFFKTVTMLPDRKMPSEGPPMNKERPEFILKIGE